MLIRFSIDAATLTYDPSVVDRDTLFRPIESAGWRHPSLDGEVRVISVIAPYLPTAYTAWDGVDVSRVVEMETDVRARPMPPQGRPQMSVDVTRVSTAAQVRVAIDYGLPAKGISRLLAYAERNGDWRTTHR